MKNYSLKYQLWSLFFKQNTPEGFTALGFVCRVFLYSGVLATILLPSLDKFKDTYSEKSRENEAKYYLETFNRTQEYYQIERGYFSNSFEDLEIVLNKNYYKFKILSPMSPVNYVNKQNNDSPSLQSAFLIAQPQPQYYKSLRSYIGAVFYEENNGNFTTAICQIDEVKDLPKTVPILKSNQTVQCPPGSTLIR